MKYFALVVVGLTTACASSSGDGNVDGGGTESCTTIADCTDDGLYCNGDVICRDGLCQETEPPNCADGISCTVDSCSEQLLGCLNTPTDSLCDEGFACLEGEGCGIPPACEFTADCQDDAYICNGAPECMDGACIDVPIDCSDSDDCTTDDCVEGDGCVNTPYDTLTDEDHCGATCSPCPEPTLVQVNVERVCAAGVCGFACLAGYWDADLSMANGCEVECPTDPLTTPDVPDDNFLDQNCDGVDGTAVDGIFVAEDGSNSNPGTREFPVKTITSGQSKALAAGKVFVYISAGDYAETVTINGTNQGIGLYGGYVRSASWARGDNRAVITGPRTGALRVQSVSTTTIVEYLHFVGSAASTASTSSHGIVVANSTGFRPRYLTAVANSGANGLQGSSAGSNGDDGGDGQDGNDGYEDDGYWYCAGDVTNPATIFDGGDSCSSPVVTSTRGGNGKRGCITNGGACAGGTGDNGQPNPAGSPSDGGPNASGAAGGGGQNGQNGGNGGNGSAGSGGTIVSEAWVPNGGGDGVRGVDGSGGGGGAGGGSNHDTGTCNDWGGGGAGGGGGGCGATGGDGGTGGGGSIAILLYNSTVTAEYVDTITGNGGTGGAGRNGGTGGPGGDGGDGGAGYDESRAGGDGGNGGKGGDGGHGGGGAGGWVVGVYRFISSWTDGGTTSATLGTVGSGGISTGNDGANGQSWPIYPAP